MESCQLVLQLPAAYNTEVLPYPFVFQADDGVALLDICELEVEDLLDMRKLTWASRPACRKTVGTFAATLGSNISLPQFPCKWGTLHSYEISCSPLSPTCNVDVWSSQYRKWGKFFSDVVRNLRVDQT